MFLINCLLSSGPSLSGPWGYDGFNKLSGDESSPEEASQGRGHRVLSPALSFSGSVGTSSCKFCRKGSSPWLELWGLRHRPLLSAVSLFPLMS